MNDSPMRVLIVGGGVAALEAALALRHLAEERVQTTVLAPNAEFVYRPLLVREPFARSLASRYPLAPVLAAAGATQVCDSLRWVDHDTHTVHTVSGAAVGYDTLLLALGGRPYSPFPGGLTLNPDCLDEQLHGLIQDVEAGYVRRVAFVIPQGRTWPLPMYELALMTATRGHSMGIELEVTIVTPEPSPLALFGPEASAAVAQLLADTGIDVVCSATPQVPSNNLISLGGPRHELIADRILTLPVIHGRVVPGIPGTASRGFIATDAHGRVRNLQSVFAAGDITDYPVKQGGIAAQQAVAVARELSRLAGGSDVPGPFDPVLYGVLLSGADPLYLRARLIGGQAASSEVSRQPLWDAADKIHTQYLTPLLSALSPGSGGASVRSLATTA